MQLAAPRILDRHRPQTSIGHLVSILGLERVRYPQVHDGMVIKFGVGLV